MKKIISLVVILLVSCRISSHAEIVREGNTFTSTKVLSTKQQPTQTKYTFKDNKGEEHPIYITSTGSCFVKRVSRKTNKEYRQYLGPEISQQICKELNITYKQKEKKK